MRLVLVAFAVALSTLLVPMGITATWLSLRVDNTEAYVDTVEPLAEEPELRDALAEEVADAATSTIAEVVPVAGAFDEAITVSTRQVVESDAFPEFWRSANAEAHREFLAIVHERDEDVVHDGWVHIDIGPLLDEVLADLVDVLPMRIDVPPRPLLVPVVPESELERGRGAYQVLEALAWWVPLLWLGLVAIAVALAPGLRGRMRAGAVCALGVAIGGVLVRLLTPSATDAVVGQVESERQDLARLMIEVVVGSLDDVATTAVVVALVVAAVLLVGSFVTGRRAPAGHP